MPLKPPMARHAERHLILDPIVSVVTVAVVQLKRHVRSTTSTALAVLGSQNLSTAAL